MSASFSRRDSREIAVKMIFQNEFVNSRLMLFSEDTKGVESTSPLFENMIDSYVDNSDDVNIEVLDTAYIQDVLSGVFANIEEIDKKIINNITDWKIDRVAKVDLAILRVAIYEMLHRADIPASVSINEAVELAKKYSHSEAGSFVNGVLGSVYTTL